MGKLLTINNKLVKLSNSFLIPYATPSPPPPFNTVTIGNQVWAATNLAIDDGDSGIIRIDSVQYYTYYNELVDIGPQYYYTLGAAERIANTIQGWHVPTEAEWNTLLTYAGASVSQSVAVSALGTRDMWTNKATANTLGFGALPAGLVRNAVSVDYQGYYAMFKVGDSAFKYCILASAPGYGETAAVINGGTTDSEYYSVRLIKDSQV